ncbi:amidohydrolase family protein [Kineosporia sp. NBRC 101731]|uniref:amidohydrolase family protein n=1 Tax=Kineosporia sp. NBRC 101731 TaxID=3032199 RepID=UPI0025534BB1|nr:amidohydrolase family protein [Kineosporia sp. NBRC 101731]
MASRSGESCDVHQHLWPPTLISALRVRREPPFLRGWTLHLPGEPPYEVNPADHDVADRLELQGDVRALISLSSPLGLEDLPASQAQPLLDTWHQGARELPSGFGAWAAVSRHEPDRSGLAELLHGDFVGLQVPAPWLATPRALEALAPVLRVCEEAGKPVLVHPGAVAQAPVEELPGWWPAVVDYTAQLSAAWWSWHHVGRALLPKLRIGFVAGAGLAPLQHERLTARGGRMGRLDPGVFVETSSYGPQAIDALVRVLGIDAIVRGSDRPYAQPVPLGFGSAADHAIDVSNPQRFLIGGRP